MNRKIMSRIALVALVAIVLSCFAGAYALASCPASNANCAGTSFVLDCGNRAYTSSNRQCDRNPNCVTNDRYNTTIKVCKTCYDDVPVANHACYSNHTVAETCGRGYSICPYN